MTPLLDGRDLRTDVIPQRLDPSGLVWTFDAFRKGDAMPKYLVHAAYTAEGLKGLQKDKASGRKTAVSAAIEGLGGKLETMYYTFGDDDVVVIMEMPDNVSASALSLAISSTGLVRTKTTPLLTIDETDKALGKVAKYKAPGK